jgi:hypothetical protein
MKMPRSFYREYASAPQKDAFALTLVAASRGGPWRRREFVPALPGGRHLRFLRLRAVTHV